MYGGGGLTRWVVCCAGRMNGSICSLPLAPSSDSRVVNVQPALRFTLDAPNRSSISTGYLALVKQQVVSSTVSALGVSPDELIVTVTAADLRRRMQGGTATLNCEIIVASPAESRLAVLANLTSQLNVDNSPLARLMATHEALGLSPGQSVGPTFACPLGTVLEDNRCNLCPADQYSPAQGSECRPCPAGHTATPETDRCLCAPGFYNTLTVAKCHAADWSATKVIGTFCEQCATHLTSCVEECQGDLLQVSEGWALINRPDGSVSIFECPGGGCPGGAVMRNETVCSPGYAGLSEPM